MAPIVFYIGDAAGDAAMEGADVPLAADWSGWPSAPAAAADEEVAIRCLSLECSSLTHPPAAWS